MNYYEAIAKKAAELGIASDVVVLTSWLCMFALGVVSAWIPAIIYRGVCSLFRLKEKP